MLQMKVVSLNLALLQLRTNCLRLKFLCLRDLAIFMNPCRIQLAYVIVNVGPGFVWPEGDARDGKRHSGERYRESFMSAEEGPIAESDILLAGKPGPGWDSVSEEGESDATQPGASYSDAVEQSASPGQQGDTPP